MKTRVLMLITAATLTFAGIASAHETGGRFEGRDRFDGRDRLDRREMRQDFRMRAGWRQGDLTRGEMRRLRAHRRHIHRMECRARSDGRMSWRERERLDRSLDRQSVRIHRFRHNGRGI